MGKDNGRLSMGVFFFPNNLNPMRPMILENMDWRVDGPLSGRRGVTKFCFVEDKHANLALGFKSIRLEREIFCWGLSRSLLGC